jgi:hypothetical protein
MIKNVILITILILFVGCSIKGSPSLWSARLADKMNSKVPFEQEMNLGYSAKMVVYKATNHNNTITYFATTNAFQTIKAESNDYESMKKANKGLCTQYLVKQMLTKGLEIIYDVKETKNSEESIQLIFNRSECSKYGYNIN